MKAAEILEGVPPFAVLADLLYVHFHPASLVAHKLAHHVFSHQTGNTGKMGKFTTDTSSKNERQFYPWTQYIHHSIDTS